METARANIMNVYYCIRHVLIEFPKSLDKNGNRVRKKCSKKIEVKVKKKAKKN